MGSLFPTVSTIIASSTADAASLAGYVTAPLIVVAFAFAAVIAATLYFRKKLVGSVYKVAGVRGRRGRGRRR